MQNFTDRVAVVTGAASGIGFETARRFATLGMRVVLLDKRASDVEAAAGLIRETSATAMGLAVDVADTNPVEKAAARVVPPVGSVEQHNNKTPGINRGGEKPT